jgi:hypothetical protein
MAAVGRDEDSRESLWWDGVQTNTGQHPKERRAEESLVLRTDLKVDSLSALRALEP